MAAEWLTLLRSREVLVEDLNIGPASENPKMFLAFSQSLLTNAAFHILYYSLFTVSLTFDAT
jgi:hypothetical protein